MSFKTHRPPTVGSASHAPVLLGVRGGGGRLCQGVPRGPATGLEIPDPRRQLAGPPRKLGRPFHTQIGSTIPDLAARFLFGCDLDHRRCAVRCLSCRHVPEFGRGEDVSSFGSSSAVYFGGMAQECVRWLPGRIGPGLAADPGSVTCGPFRPDLGRLRLAASGRYARLIVRFVSAPHLGHT